MPIRRILNWANRQPDALAIVEGSVRLSYQEFLGAIALYQIPFLQCAGPRSGTAVIVTKHLMEAWLASLAARSLGLNAIAVQTFDALKTLKLSNIHSLTTNSFAEFSDEGSGLNGLESNRIVKLAPVSDLCLKNTPAPQIGDCFGSQLLYTTGTTGTSKKVLMDGTLEDQRNQYRAECFSLKRSTVAYTNLPPYSGAGFKTPSAVWHLGGAVVFDRTLDLLSHLRRDGVNSVLGGPNQIRGILSGTTVPEELRHSFEIVYTSGPFPYELAKLAAEKLSRHISIYYGATEIIGRPLRARFRGVSDLVWLKPEPDREVRIVRDTGDKCDVGEEGLLAIKLAGVDASEYLDDPETSSQIFRGGFFIPGDLAVMRKDGRVRLLGRMSDVVNIRGTKKSVAPIELAIQAYLKADEVCIFSDLNDAGEEEALVAIRIDREISQVEMNHIGSRLLPMELVRFARLSHFPKSEGAFGKTLRGELRKLLYSAKPRTS